MDTLPQERRYTDRELLETLCEIALDLVGCAEEDWYYSIGWVLGNLSTQVFPATLESIANGRRSTADGGNSTRGKWRKHAALNR